MQVPIILYNLLAIFILIFFTVREARMHRLYRWLIIYALELAACIINLCLSQYFDNLPGGMLGFAHFGEWLSCLIFGFIHVALIIATACTHIVAHSKQLPDKQY